MEYGRITAFYGFRDKWLMKDEESGEEMKTNVNIGRTFCLEVA